MSLTIDVGTISVIANALLSVVLAFAGKHYFGIKKRVDQLIEIINVAKEALVDDSLSPAEVKEIVGKIEQLLKDLGIDPGIIPT